MVMESKGGFDFQSLYHMPVPFRRVYVTLMQRRIEEREAQYNAMNKTTGTPSKQLLGPNGKPMTS